MKFCSSGAMVMAAILGLMMAMAARAQDGDANCQAKLMTLQPCLFYLLPGNSTHPGSECCKPMLTIANSTKDVQCLCQLTQFASKAGEVGNMAIKPNITRATEILHHCKINSTTIPCLASVAMASAPSPMGDMDMESAAAIFIPTIANYLVTFMVLFGAATLALSS